MICCQKNKVTDLCILCPQFLNKLVKELPFVSIEYIVYLLVKKKKEGERRTWGGRRREWEEEERGEEKEEELEEEGQPSHTENQSINQSIKAWTVD